MNEVIELESIPTKIEYKGIIWIPQPTSNETVDYHIPRKSDVVYEHHTKQSYLVKWLQKNKTVGDVFTLDEFFRKYPKHRKDAECRRRIEKIMDGLLKDSIITQWTKPDNFRIIKPIQDQK